MKNILIIGCGQLGMRHLQALGKVAANLNIFLVDPFPEALEKSRKAFTSHTDHPQVISSFSSLANLPLKKFDVIINASTADYRINILKEIFELKFQYGLLILEKVLFQSLEDYDIAERLIDTKKTVVNCPRRSYDFYKTLKKDFDSKDKFQAKFTSTQWGLACNSVHYIDLLQFLSGKKPVTVDTHGLEKNIVPSKRNGFIEFYGMIDVVYDDGSVLKLNCSKEDSETSLEIVQTHKSFMVKEQNGQFFIIENEKSTLYPLSVPYQSELTGIVVQRYFDNLNCELPSYQEAKQDHLPFIKALLEFYNKISNTNHRTLPIT